MIDDQQLNQLEMQEEAAKHKLTIAEQEALIKKAKAKYGPDWKKFLNVHSGMDWEALKFKME